MILFAVIMFKGFGNSFWHLVMHRQKELFKASDSWYSSETLSLILARLFRE